MKPIYSVWVESSDDQTFPVKYYISTAAADKYAFKCLDKVPSGQACVSSLSEGIGYYIIKPHTHIDAQYEGGTRDEAISAYANN